MAEIIEKFSKNLLKKNRGTSTVKILPPTLQSVTIKNYLKTKRNYSVGMKKNMASFLAGKMSDTDFLKSQKLHIQNAFGSAYQLGKFFGTGGLSDIDDQERRFLVYQVTKEMDFMKNFANDLKNSTGKMNYSRRMDMYVDSLDSMFGFGRLVYLPENVQIIWELGSTDKHCPDCLMFALKNPYTKKNLPGLPKSGNSRCFVGKTNQLMILTQRGWVQFRNMTNDDMVLSHNGKWKEILDIIEYKCDDLEELYQVELEFENKPTNQNYKYNVLSDHMFLTEDGWKQACELSDGSEVYIMGHQCKHCKKIITYEDSRAINFDYCSCACSSKGIDHWKKGREKLVEKYGSLGTGLAEYRSVPENLEKSKQIGREALSKVHKSRVGKTYEEMYGKERADILRYKCTKKANERTRILAKNGKNALQRFMRKMTKEERSEFCRKARACLTHEQFIKLLNERTQLMLSKGIFTFSKPEKLFHEILKKLNINYECEKLVDNRFFDVYLPDNDIYIEIDGDFIHSNPKFYDENNLKAIQIKQRVNDNIKNEIMRDKTFIRFWEDDVKNNPEFVENKLKLILKNHNGEFVKKLVKIKTIKKVKLNDVIGSTVMSLTVKDDESFVVKGGLIAHNCLSNCRCSIRYVYPTGTAGSKYDQTILKGNGYNGKKIIPTEDEFVSLMKSRDEFYHNRLMYERTKLLEYKKLYQDNMAEIKSYVSKNNLYFPVDFKTRNVVSDFKKFNTHKNFEFVTAQTAINNNDFVTFFVGDKNMYGKVTDTLGEQIIVKTLDSSEFVLHISRNMLYKEV